MNFTKNLTKLFCDAANDTLWYFGRSRKAIKLMEEIGSLEEVIVEIEKVNGEYGERR